MRSVSLRLQSLNQKTLTEYHDLSRSLLHGFVFWFFFLIFVWFIFWFPFDCSLTGQMGFKTDCGVRVWVWGEKVCPHTYPHHWNPDKQGVSDRLWGCEGKRKKTFFIVQGNGHAVLSAFYMASKVKTKQWLSKRLQGHFEEVAVQSYALQKSGDRWNDAFLFCSKKLSKYLSILRLIIFLSVFPR